MFIMNDPVAERFGCDFVEGGVALAHGFVAAGVHAGFRDDPERLDMALVVADDICAAAGVFTQNVFCAAPVSVCREHLNEDDAGGRYFGTARALIVNSGNANAACGPDGLFAAQRTADMVAEAIGCSPEDVLVASTGLIGVPLSLDPFKTGIPAALAEINEQKTVASADGAKGALARNKAASDAACAILTTDTHSKECAVVFSGDDIGYPGCTFTVGGMTKGSGMIMPNMATMISVISTDAPIRSADLSTALTGAVKISFNRLTVDGDTSTNDSCFLLSSGAAAPGCAPFGSGSAAFSRFEDALRQVCCALARAMASDGEGATRLVTVNVTGAASDEDAARAAYAVANSTLVKTAIYGNDANWGRIIAALGHAGAEFCADDVSIKLMGMDVFRAGRPCTVDEDEALKRFSNHEIVIDIDLGRANASTTVWTCDLSHEYVSINGDYRS